MDGFHPRVDGKGQVGQDALVADRPHHGPLLSPRDIDGQSFGLECLRKMVEVGRCGLGLENDNHENLLGGAD